MMRRIYFSLILIVFCFAGKAQTFTWSGYHHIDDGTTFTVPIVVSGLQNTIDNNFGVAHVCLNITHSYEADLTIKLQSPDGTQTTLIENIGGAGDNFLGTCIGLDGVAFTVGQPPYGGIYYPVGNTSAFNNGQNPNGTWLLSVTDVAAPDTGSIHSAYIEFTNNPPVLPGTNYPPLPVGNYLCGTCSCPGGVAGCDLLPDMTASALEIASDHLEQPGVLYISNATPNIGWGPLDIYGIDSCFCSGVHVPCNTICPNGAQIQHVVKQRIYQKVPGKDTLNYYDRFAGKMTFHPTHGHLHVDNWANYTLRTSTSNPDPRTWPILARGSKQSFCLINLGSCASTPGECVDNNGNTVLTVPNNGLGWHSGCGLFQGIYPGSFDVYSQSLNDPMPLENICNGTYYIVSITDPDNNFIESDENNNWVAVPITLTQQNVTPSIAAGSSTTFCQGGSVTLTSSPAASYLWSTGETTQSITVSTAGTFYVTTSCGATVLNSNSITTNIIQANSSAGVSISITNGNNPSCAGVYTVFTANPVNGGNAPIYQWKVNGSVVGTNSPTYSSSSLNNGDIVTCTITSDIACLVNSTAVSNGITMVIQAPLDPNVSITQSGGIGPVCAGSPVTFTANVSNGLAASYQWKVAGANVGTNANTYTTTGLITGQQVRCDISANTICPVTKTLGTAVTLNDPRSNLGTAYPTWYGNGRQQYLILASELNAFGAVPGKISSLTFNINSTLGDPLTLNNYTIKMGQTAATSLTGAFQAPVFTTVFGPVNYTPVPNSLNRHLFTTAFDWDGSSNVIIDICFSNQVVGNGAYQNYQSATAFVSTTYYQADGSAGANACSAATGTAGSMRPNMQLTISNRVPAVSNVITMTVSPVTNVYTFTGTGNWNVAANWSNSTIPPNPLTGRKEIIIDPPAGQECILNVPQTVSSGGKITVKQTKKFRILDNLTIIQ